MHRISFFDDSIKHIDAARSVVPSALVPYHSESQLNILAPQAIPDMEDRAFTPIKPKKTQDIVMTKSYQHLLIKLAIIATMTMLLRQSTKPTTNKTILPKYYDKSD